MRHNQHTGWGIELAGHDEDTTIWSRHLRPPFEPHVEHVKKAGAESFVLRSSQFDSLDTVGEVYDAAARLISILNVTLSKAAGAELVAAGPVVEFTADGNFRTHYILKAEPAAMRLRFGMAEATVRDTQGNIIPPVPAPSQAQRWAQVAAAKPTIGEALRYLEGQPGWIELYKAHEALRKLARPVGISNNEVSRFAQTANFEARHHPNSERLPPKSPMPIWEARAFITKWAAAVIKAAIENPS